MNKIGGVLHQWVFFRRQTYVSGDKKMFDITIFFSEYLIMRSTIGRTINWIKSHIYDPSVS